MVALGWVDGGRSYVLSWSCVQRVGSNGTQFGVRKRATRDLVIYAFRENGPSAGVYGNIKNCAMTTQAAGRVRLVILDNPKLEEIEGGICREIWYRRSSQSSLVFAVDRFWIGYFVVVYRLQETWDVIEAAMSLVS
jgi:hypothetical protein